MSAKKASRAVRIVVAAAATTAAVLSAGCAQQMPAPNPIPDDPGNNQDR
ncbi:hypothetical protein [Mycobacterium kubicae]|uniref:Lipoprotein n=1 Tax=Mycobacterium kubicae TaxID=120959 RepID=A0AAX1JFS5_9MYCO|nr:hypothetical protein [Mycobacterium kubicae]MCV7098372.1 hypothetical protein [Mycobacterium kubicae]QPI39430.1 hypothetical protein I2456_08215 [Mycobacterium kubicae]